MTVLSEGQGGKKSKSTVEMEPFRGFESCLGVKVHHPDLSTSTIIHDIEMYGCTSCTCEM